MQFVQFSDSSETKIVSWFGSPQDSMTFPNQGEVADDDPRYVAFLAEIDNTPTTVQINTARRNQLLGAANLVIPALQDAVDLDDPSANQALLLAWKQFRVAVNKVNLTILNPTWPVPPQPGYGAAIAPPVSSS